ncbi:hypothetical protein PRIPAC_94296 [Pristionchus pacificus]|uniref:Uncharacterized protein n=1 Tax=Pristionchus pacificus TaxID=54126 RepID=A0A2A6BB22_PRIPA|nr:hypothetical protein PRIPAC_94296 [Pristionchus pacificus]|eukprot:PDM63079.1 hypothetical protein PRIPAC_50294 [Pristionchus pacificus]
MAGGADDAEANVDLEEKREDDDDVQGEEMRRRKALSDAQRGPLPRLSFPPGTTAGTKIQEKEKYVKKLRRDYRHSLLKGEEEKVGRENAFQQLRDVERDKEEVEAQLTGLRAQVAVIEETKRLSAEAALREKDSKHPNKFDKEREQFVSKIRPSLHHPLNSDLSFLTEEKTIVGLFLVSKDPLDHGKAEEAILILQRNHTGGYKNVHRVPSGDKEVIVQASLMLSSGIGQGPNTVQLDRLKGANFGSLLSSLDLTEEERKKIIFSSFEGSRGFVCCTANSVASKICGIVHGTILVGYPMIAEMKVSSFTVVCIRNLFVFPSFNPCSPLFD